MATRAELLTEFERLDRRMQVLIGDRHTRSRGFEDAAARRVRRHGIASERPER